LHSITDEILPFFLIFTLKVGKIILDFVESYIETFEKLHIFRILAFWEIFQKISVAFLSGLPIFSFKPKEMPVLFRLNFIIFDV